MVFDSMFDMVLGMGLGMVASPIMMRALKNLKQKRRINSILREISEIRKT